MTDPDRTNGAMALIGMVDAGTMAQALYVAAKLGVADILADGPKTSEQVATWSMPTPTRSAGCCGPRGARRVRGARRRQVRADGPGNPSAIGRRGLGPFMRVHWAGSVRSASARLLHCVKNGRNPRDLVTGKDPFESLSRNSEAERIFDDAMGR
jgi:hypothetical protein